MEKITEYRRLIKELLSHYAELLTRRPKPGKDIEVVFDEEHGHYMLISVGWSGQHRVRGTTVYIRLRNGKFYIEEDWLEHGITQDLLQRHVPKEDIVLAFQPPEIRPLTEFAVA